jgi:ABC-type Fe3+ transport system substrate-binding protein
MGTQVISGGRLGRKPLAMLVPLVSITLLAACSSGSNGGSNSGSSSSPTGSTPVAQSSAQSSGGGSPQASNDMDTMTMDQLYAKAKEEGEVVAYGTSSDSDIKAYTAGFDKKYPGIKIVHTKQQGEEAASKMSEEARAGVYAVDVLNTEQNTIYAMAQTGLLAKYSPPEAASFDPRFKNPYFTGFRIQVKPIAYNTKLISPAEAPKSYDDLLDPKWKGKICEEATDVSVFADRLQDIGEAAGVAYWKKLVNDQHMRFVSGQTALEQDVVSGECPIAFSTNIHGPASDAIAGAPVGWVKTDPIYANYGALGIAAKAPHPYAARLWVNYMLSTTGQQAVADAYRVPANSAVQPKEPELQNGDYKIVLAGDDVMKKFTYYNDLFYKTTGRPVVGQ